MKSPSQVLAEAARVLKPKGKLILGAIPRESPLATYYMRKAEQGHIFYSRAKFYSRGEIMAMAEENFKILESGREKLPSSGELPEGEFLCLLFEKRS